MIKLKSLKITRKILVVFLSVLVVLFSLAPMSSAVVTYPAGVTPEQAQSAMKNTDSVIKAVVETMEGKSLSDVVLSMLFSGDTLSSLAKTMYSMSEENGDTFSTIGIDFSPAAVSAYLTDYPSVQSAMASAASWSTLDLSGADWGVSTTAEFIEAAVDLFTPMNDLLYTILCGGSYSVNTLVGLKGANGYANSVVRIYTKCGMDSYTDAATFEAQAAENKGSMITNIITDLARYVTRICAAPATMLSTKLPGIAYFVNNGGLDQAITSLVDPLRLQVLGITTPFKVGSIMDIAQQGEEGMSFDFKLDLNSFSASGTLKTAPFDLAELAGLAFDDIDTYVVNTSDSFMYILRWIIETAKLNADSLPSMLSGTQTPVDGAQLQQTVSRLFSKSTDELITIYIGLLAQTEGKINPFTWTFQPVTPMTVTYTPNLGQEKYQRVLDGIDDLIGQFIKESGEAGSIREALAPQIYSNKLVTELVVGIYGIFQSEEMGGLASLLGVDMSPAGLAKTLTEDGYASARQALSNIKSFDQLKNINMNWGFKDGSKAGFGITVCAVFRPLDPLLRMVLCAEKADILGGIPFYGSDGYNTAVIPLLEALGCTYQEIRTYDEFCQQIKGKDVMIPIMKAILSLTERMLDYPVYTLTGILPNLMYFINNGGIEICIRNLLYPVTSTLAALGISDMLDLTQITNIDMKQVADKLTAELDLGIILPELDISQFGTIGTLIPAQTKRTQAGQPMTIQYLQADRTGVLITFLRYIVEIMKTPGNEGIVDSFMNTSGGDNEMFATYSTGIDEELANMSVDETVEWLYKIFFRERATVDEVDPDYTPTVIYTETRSVNWEAVIGAVFAVLLFAVIIALFNRDKLASLFGRRKRREAQNEEA